MHKQTINQHPYRRHFSEISWSVFFIVSAVVFMMTAGIGYASGNFTLLLIPAVFMLIWVISRFKSMQKMARLDAFQIPSYILSDFSRQYPGYGVAQIQQIEEGFKDYLALHLIKKQAYAMPSKSVDALWHLLLEKYAGFYAEMCQQLLGFQLYHYPHAEEVSAGEHRAHRLQLLHSWQVSCRLHGVKGLHPEQIPRLFQVDQNIAWSAGFIFQMTLIYALYDQFSIRDSGSNSSSCSSSTSGTSSHSDSRDCSESSSSSDSSSSCSSCSSCGGGGGD
jgi:hypothetical protein